VAELADVAKSGSELCLAQVPQASDDTQLIARGLLHKVHSLTMQSSRYPR
jgi:hypothetical protein